jgi:large subunit ribosomal protein L28
MSQRCDRCGKSPMSGNNVSHSKVRTRRRFMPNLQPARVLQDGRLVRATLCTRCLRTATKAPR